MLPDSNISPSDEGAAVRLMLELGIAPQEVAEATMAARKRRGAFDSPRWCASCNRYGNHHTDRCPDAPATSRKEATT